MVEDVRFFTSADARYFVGAAALVNSLRISGNRHPVYVVDCGLTPGQRERLARGAELLPVPPAAEHLHPQFVKLVPDLFWDDGVVVLLDTDMIVTGSLDYLVDHARTGRIAVHPDHEIGRHRLFSEWAPTFGLRAPLRPQPCVNTAPLAIALERWPGFFARWREACALLPDDWQSRGLDVFGPADQDALNAILMSEIDAGALWIGDARLTVHADGFPDVEIVDPEALACTYRGIRPTVFHYGMSPKAWRRQAWSRVRPDDAYVRLFPRLVYGRGAPVRTSLREAPPWLWPHGAGRFAAAVVHWLHVVGLLNFVRRSRNSVRTAVMRLATALVRAA